MVEGDSTWLSRGSEAATLTLGARKPMRRSPEDLLECVSTVHMLQLVEESPNSIQLEL